jgi:WXXGXW repeat (2 copies)
MRNCAIVVMGLLSVLSSTACTVRATAPSVVVRTPEIVVSRPPPPIRVEEMPPPPGAPEAYVWQPGHWHWNGQDYVWRAGHYEHRPSATARWVPAEWVAKPNGQWVFHPGHWVS